MNSHNIKSSDEFTRSLYNTREYAFTIRHNPKYHKGTKVPYTKDEKMKIYSEVLTYVANTYNGKLVRCAFELKGGIHIHGTFTFSKVPYFKLIKYKDVHFKWRKVYSLGWISYINKEVFKACRKDQREIIDYYSKNYGFRPTNK